MVLTFVLFYKLKSSSSSREHEKRGGYERGGYSRGGFVEEGPTSPRREFSRSMSSENWREAKREEGDDGDWRRAGGHKDRWGKRGF